MLVVLLGEADCRRLGLVLRLPFHLDLGHLDLDHPARFPQVHRHLDLDHRSQDYCPRAR